MMLLEVSASIKKGVPAMQLKKTRSEGMSVPQVYEIEHLEQASAIIRNQNPKVKLVDIDKELYEHKAIQIGDYIYTLEG